LDSQFDTFRLSQIEDEDEEAVHSPEVKEDKPLTSALDNNKNNFIKPKEDILTKKASSYVSNAINLNDLITDDEKDSNMSY
jgi:hypothetical protein